MSFVVIIPARFASTRLPASHWDINGKPMIVHVLERARIRPIALSSRRIMTMLRVYRSRRRRSVHDACRPSIRHRASGRKWKSGFSDDTDHRQYPLGDEPMIPAGDRPPVADNLAANTCGMATLPFRSTTLRKHLIRMP